MLVNDNDAHFTWVNSDTLQAHDEIAYVCVCMILANI